MSPDVLIVSFPKSGRTWVRVFLSRYRQQLNGLANFDIHLHRRSGQSGVTYDFTHAGSDPKFGILKLRKHLLRNSERRLLSNLPEYFYGIRRIRIPAGAGRYLFLVRDPRDVLVSFYHQARSRNRFWSGSIDAFARHPYIGIARIVALMNHLAREADKLNAPFFHYEDLSADPDAEFQRLLNAAGDVVEPDLVREAIEYASFDNMRRMEQSGRYGKRLKARRRHDPSSLKTRRGEIGAYTSELPDDTTGFVEDYLDRHLEVFYGRYLYRT